MNKKRFICLLLACLICLGALSPALAAAQEDVIYIDSVEDFLAFGKSCTLDIWSQGKSFRLTADIDLTGLSFQGVPTFGGSLDGQDHTITGLDIGGSLSQAGLFGIIQQGALVKNLNVTGMVTPSGTQEILGGIAGVNHGTVENCRFSGTVRGGGYVGGIVGKNESSGVVSGCTGFGMVSGAHFTGGTVGHNSGTITGCVNNSSVNTDSVDESLSLEDFQIDWEQLRSTENIAAHTDTGGVAGYSTGTIEACINNGAIGYPHVGYNVGGIAGRQSGFMSGCTNNGAINGRKDIGGIVGQMTPDISLIFSQSEIQDLQTELNVLEQLIDKALTDAESGSSDVSAEIDRAAGYLSSARESANEIGGQLGGFVDDNVKTVNQLLDRLRYYMGELSNVLRPLETASEHASDAFSEMSGLVSQTDGLSSITGGAMESLEDAALRLRSAAGSFESGAAELGAAVRALDGSLELPGLQDELAQLETDIDGLALSLMNLADDIDAALYELEETGQLSPAALESLVSGFSDIMGASGRVAADVMGIVRAIDWSQLEGASESVDEALAHLARAMEHFLAAFAALDGSQDALTDFLRGISELNGELPAISGQLQTVLKSLSAAGDSLADAIGGLNDWVRDFGSGDLHFAELGSGYSESTERLNAALTGFSGVITGLNDKIGSSSRSLTQDMKEINSQLVKVMNLMLDAVSSMGSPDSEDYYEDISDEVIEQARAGKASGCINHGTVEGDVNIGGVTGSMAIEYDLDPEDDISTTGTRSHSFKYRTQSILVDSINYAAVTAKKNCSGGMVGRMDLGTVSGCESYGPVSSTSGDYVGGIVGQSLSTVRKSSAKCFLSGRRYVAGVAGSGENIYDCYTMVKLEGEAQNTEAIAGEAKGTLSGNRFVSDELAGIDRLSVAGRAEPMTYGELLEIEGLPLRFRSLVIRFVAGETLVDTVTINYGDSLDADSIPDIPVKDGCYGVWDRKDFTSLVFDETIEAQYSRYYSTLAGDLTRGNGQPAVLADGRFLHEEKLTVTEEDGSFMVVIPDDGADTHLLRYQPMDGTAESTEIHVLNEGRWQRASCDTLGSYLLFEVEGNEVRFKEVASESSASAIYIFAAIAAGVVLVLVCIRLVRSRKKRKRSG